VRRRTLVRSLIAGSFALPLGAEAGCDGANDDDTTLTAVTCMTSYGSYGRDAYIYLAREKGYFEEAGFTVDIRPGAGTASNLKLVVDGKATFSPADLSGCLIAAGGKQKVTGFTAVAGIHQRTLTGIITMQGSGIAVPKDLEGRTLADVPGSVLRTLFPTYARLADFDYTKVTWVDATAQTVLRDLVAGRFDGIGQFVIGVPTIEALAKGRKALALPFSDYLRDLYGNVLITSTGYARNNPGRVRRFTTALLKGLSDAIDNPAQASEALRKYVPGADPEAAAAETVLMGPYVRSAAAGVSVGALEPARVARSIAILQGSGQINTPMLPEQVVSLNLLPHT
jgi:NitT/TauT family transport system substrate-binding protein